MVVRGHFIRPLKMLINQMKTNVDCRHLNLKYYFPRNFASKRKMFVVIMKEFFTICKDVFLWFDHCFSELQGNILVDNVLVGSTGWVHILQSPNVILAETLAVGKSQNKIAPEWKSFIMSTCKFILSICIVLQVPIKRIHCCFKFIQILW